MTGQFIREDNTQFYGITVQVFKEYFLLCASNGEIAVNNEGKETFNYYPTKKEIAKFAEKMREIYY